MTSLRRGFLLAAGGSAFTAALTLWLVSPAAPQPPESSPPTVQIDVQPLHAARADGAIVVTPHAGPAGDVASERRVEPRHPAQTPEPILEPAPQTIVAVPDTLQTASAPESDLHASALQSDDPNDPALRKMDASLRAVMQSGSVVPQRVILQTASPSLAGPAIDAAPAKRRSRGAEYRHGGWLDRGTCPSLSAPVARIRAGDDPHVD